MYAKKHIIFIIILATTLILNGVGIAAGQSAAQTSRHPEAQSAMRSADMYESQPATIPAVQPASQPAARAMRAAPPGRPIIMNDSVYTSWGTPIRGASEGLEASEPSYTVTVEQLRALRDNGLNTLHLYIEHPYTGKPVGEQAEKCDQIIEDAAREGMYVIITIGWIELMTEEDVQFFYDFWELYSKRYKDNENVIFEMANEHNWPKNGPEVVANAYKIIRKNAPDTMVLLFSFAVSPGPEHLIPRIKDTEKLADIDWSNAAIAFHAYESEEGYFGADYLIEVIDAFTEAGYPIINTELPNRFALTSYPDMALFRVMEERGLS